MEEQSSSSTSEHEQGQQPLQQQEETVTPSTADKEPSQELTVDSSDDKQDRKADDDNTTDGKEEQPSSTTGDGVCSPPSDDGTSTDSPPSTACEAKQKIKKAHIVELGDEKNSRWSRYGKDELIDKIKGLIYGQAIGDAIGLATEFLSKKQARSKDWYGPKGPSSYDDIIQDGHRSRWERGDWTDDTDQMLLILLGIVANNGEVSELDFAKRIHEWMGKGFPELGDYGGMGIGMTVGRVLRHHDFLTNPHSAAKEIWEDSGRYLAANGAVMRTAILGVLNFNDIPKVIENTKKISGVTHADPRCTASCISVTTAIALLLQGKYDVSKKKELEALVEEAIKNGSDVLEHKDQQKEMREHILSKDLKNLKLDDPKAIGYTFKTLGCGFYGLRKGNDFKKIIWEVIMEAGDADTNAAVCGAVLGCKIGYSALPEDLMQFPHRAWLDKQVDSFLHTIGLI